MSANDCLCTIGKEQSLAKSEQSLAKSKPNYSLVGLLFANDCSLPIMHNKSLPDNPCVSDKFEEAQGIRQGRVTSTGMFKARSNPILYTLQRHPGKLLVGHLLVGALMVADDLVLSSHAQEGLQALVTEATRACSMNNNKFEKKSMIYRRWW